VLAGWTIFAPHLNTGVVNYYEAFWQGVFFGGILYLLSLWAN